MNYYCLHIFLCRPSIAALLNEITDLMTDDFDRFHGKGKLVIMDELIQSNKTESENAPKLIILWFLQ